MQNLIELVNQRLTALGCPPNMVVDMGDGQALHHASSYDVSLTNIAHYYVIFRYINQEPVNLMFGAITIKNPETPSVLTFNTLCSPDPTVWSLDIYAAGELSLNLLNDMYYSNTRNNTNYLTLPLNMTDSVVRDYIKSDIIHCLHPAVPSYSGGLRRKRIPKKKTRRVKAKKTKKRKSHRKTK
ncbi:MAG: hypothetical protein WCI04_01705 [archaeon]